MNPLQVRLGRLRRCLRMVVLVRGLGWLAAALLVGAVVACAFDWLRPLPPFIRVVLLASLLTSAGILAYRYLFLPLRAPSDDLSLALQVEARYPRLNDSLASTVQFLEQGPKVHGGESTQMRREAIERALVQARKCNFSKTIDSRGLRLAGFLFEIACALAVPLILFQPTFTRIALARLVDPFGRHSWTELDVNGRRVTAANQPYHISGTLNGVVPKQATVYVSFQGNKPDEWSKPDEYLCEVVPGERAHTGSLQFHLEQVARNFRFQVRAHDAVSDWQEVQVVPPPRLEPTEPVRIRLHYPEYTGLVAVELPPNCAYADAVLGTRVTVEARVNTPITRAWMQYRWPGKFALGGMADEQALWGRIPVQVGGDGRTLTADFVPWATGRYEIHFQNEEGLANFCRLPLLRIEQDPAPVVALECPAAAPDLQESQVSGARVLVVSALADGELRLICLADDQPDRLRYGVRSLWLECRCPEQTAPRKLLLYDRESVETLDISLTAPALLLAALSPSLASAAAVLDTSSLALRAPSLALRAQHVRVPLTLALKQLRCAAMPERELRPGDVVVLQAVADDFDNVTVNKPPGRSREIVKVRIISREQFDAQLTEEQAEIQKRLWTLENLESTARRKTVQAAQDVKDRRPQVARELAGLLQGPLERVAIAEVQQEQRAKEAEDIANALRPALAQINPDPILRLAVAEEQRAREARNLARSVQDLEDAGRTQQKITDDLGSKQDVHSDTVRRDVERLLEKLRDNHLQESPAYERLETIAAELDRRESPVSHEQLRRIETDLAAAQRQRLNREAAPAGQPNPLTEAAELQRRARQRLEDLAQLLEPGSQLHESKAEARAILEDQRKLDEQLRKLNEDPEQRGKLPQELTPNQRAELERLEEAQHRQAERLQRLLDKMEAEARDTGAKDPELARALRDARARAQDLPARMREEENLIRQNQLSEATRQQTQEVEPELEKLVKDLQQRREAELERLTKKLAEVDEELQKLTREQEQLRKKIEQANRQGDDATRERELKGLASEQEALNRRLQAVQEQLQQLSRRRGQQASKDVDEALRTLNDGLKKLEAGKAPDEKAQRDAIQRMDEAHQDLEQQRVRAEEELAREQLEKSVDLIRHIKDRQQALIAERERLQTEVTQNKQWNRVYRSSLGDLAENQKGLGQEVLNLAKDKLAGAEVVAATLTYAARSMNQAGQYLGDQQERVLDRPTETALDPRAVAAQQEALERLDEVLEAIKPKPRKPSEPAPAPNGERGGRSRRADGSGGDGIGDKDQLELLRKMQLRVHRRSAAFHKLHPDGSKLTPEQETERQDIIEQQQQIIDLFAKKRPADAEGAKP